MNDAVYWGPEAIISSTSGTPVRKAAMEIREELSGNLAALYADAARASALPNPTKTDQYGNLAFYIDPGTYLVSMLGSDFTFKIVISASGSGSGGGGRDPFEFVQSVPQSVWSISHNFGVRPASVSVFSLDYATEYDEFTVQHVNPNQLIISMDVPSSGRALML